MPYQLFKPHRIDRISSASAPRYISSDPAVAHLFHSYGWVVLHVRSLPSAEESESAIWWDTHSDDDDDEDEPTEIAETSYIRQCSGIRELHHPGIVLDEVVAGPQVEERVVWNISWMADWDLDRDVDLRVVLGHR